MTATTTTDAKVNVLIDSLASSKPAALSNGDYIRATTPRTGAPHEETIIDVQARIANSCAESKRLRIAALVHLRSASAALQLACEADAERAQLHVTLLVLESTSDKLTQESSV